MVAKLTSVDFTLDTNGQDCSFKVKSEKGEYRIKDADAYEEYFADFFFLKRAWTKRKGPRQMKSLENVLNVYFSKRKSIMRKRNELEIPCYQLQ